MSVSRILSRLRHKGQITEAEYRKLMDIKSAAKHFSKSPCDLCRFNPPSSTDGKPCTMCPAERGDTNGNNIYAR